MSAWISNYIHYKVCDEITYPFPNFNGEADTSVSISISVITFAQVYMHEPQYCVYTSSYRFTDLLSRHQAIFIISDWTNLKSKFGTVQSLDVLLYIDMIDSPFYRGMVPNVANGKRSSRNHNPMGLRPIDDANMGPVQPDLWHCMIILWHTSRVSCQKGPICHA